MADIAAESTPLLGQLLDDWRTLSDALWKETNTPRERGFIVCRQVDLFGAAYLLAVLRAVDPTAADRAAAFLAAQWNSGEELGEWICRWKRELQAGKPLTLSCGGES